MTQVEGTLSTGSLKCPVNLVTSCAREPQSKSQAKILHTQYRNVMVHKSTCCAPAHTNLHFCRPQKSTQSMG